MLESQKRISLSYTSNEGTSSDTSIVTKSNMASFYANFHRINCLENSVGAEHQAWPHEDFLDIWENKSTAGCFYYILSLNGHHLNDLPNTVAKLRRLQNEVTIDMVDVLPPPAISTESLPSMISAQKELQDAASSLNKINVVQLAFMQARMDPDPASKKCINEEQLSKLLKELEIPLKVKPGGLSMNRKKKKGPITTKVPPRIKRSKSLIELLNSPTFSEFATQVSANMEKYGSLTELLESPALSEIANLQTSK